MMKRQFTLVCIFHLYIIGYFFISCSRNNTTSFDTSQTQIDSLLKKANKSINTGPLLSRQFYKEALSLETDSTKWYAILSKIATTYLYTADYDSAIQIINRINTRYHGKQEITSEEHFIIGHMYNMKSFYQSYTTQHDSVLYNLEKCVNHFELSGATNNLPYIYINLVDHHSRNGNYIEAISYSRKALAINDSITLPGHVRSIIHNLIGRIYTELHNFELADFYLDKAYLELDSLILLNDKFAFYNNRGYSCYVRNQIEQAIPYFEEAFALVKDNKEYQYQNAIIKGNLGEAYLLTNQLDSAQYYLDQAIVFFQKTNNISGLYHTETLKFELEIRRNNLSAAKRIMENFVSDDKIEPAHIRFRKKYLQHYYEKIRDYENAYKYLIEYKNLEDSISNTLIKMRAEETDMRYKHDAALVEQSHLIERQQVEMESLQLNRYIWILASILLLLTAAFIYLYMRRQRAYIAEKHRNRIVQLRMENIRNRVSPHFIFNILNHIISRFNRKDKSYQELFNLIKLMRLNLTLTEKLDIPLDEELDFVETYVQARQQESGLPIQLTIKVDKHIDTSNVHIPSMIIQIPVENAIKHGFRNRDNDNNSIVISVNNDSKNMVINIEDNGEGFYMQPHNHDYQSTGTGLKVLTQTIELLNSYNRNKIIFHIENKKENSGCIVTYTIPHEFGYQVNK